MTTTGSWIARDACDLEDCTMRQYQHRHLADGTAEPAVADPEMHDGVARASAPTAGGDLAAQLRDHVSRLARSAYGRGMECAPALSPDEIDQQRDRILGVVLAAMLRADPAAPASEAATEGGEEDADDERPMTPVEQRDHDAYYDGAGMAERTHDAAAQRRGFNSSGALYAWVDGQLTEGADVALTRIADQVQYGLGMYAHDDAREGERAVRQALTDLRRLAATPREEGTAENATEGVYVRLRDGVAVERTEEVAEDVRVDRGTEDGLAVVVGVEVVGSCAAVEIDGRVATPREQAAAEGEITSVEELEELAVGTPLRDNVGHLYERTRDDCGTWTGAYSRIGRDWPDVPKLPARLLSAVAATPRAGEATGGDLATQDRRAAGSLAAAYRRGYRDAWPDIAPEPVIVVPDDLAVPTATDVGWALPLGDHPTRSELEAPTTRAGWATLLDECIDALPGDTRTDIAVKLAKLRRVLAAAPRAEDAGPDAP